MSQIHARKPFMGLSVRTSEWRYTEWYPWNKVKKEPVFVYYSVPSELYNHTLSDDDFNANENVNHAGAPELAATQAALREVLLNHFQNDGGAGWGPNTARTKVGALGNVAVA